MKYLYLKRKTLLMLILSLVMILSMSITASASSDVNTDSDIEPYDGEYTFTGNGDWYGYTSYLNLDNNSNFIRARSYKVTLPSDGRLFVELNAKEKVFLDVYIMTEEEYTLYDDPEWQFGSSSEPMSVRKKTEMLKAGKYKVEFWYPLSSRDDLSLYWPPGYNEFYHKLTFVTLSSDEKAAFNVEKKINSLPDQNDISLNDESAVASVKSEYDLLTAAQKALIRTVSADKLNSIIARIDKLKEDKAKEDADMAEDSSSDDKQGGDGQTPDGQTPDDQTPYDQTPDESIHQHNYSEWTTVKSATEIAAGLQTRTCSVCGNKEAQETAQLAPTLKAVKISKPKVAKKAAAIKWKKVSKKDLKKIKKIEIQYSTDKNFESNVQSRIVSAKKTLYKIKKLKAKKRYYVRIRSYTKSGNEVHVSKWSAKKSFKTK